MVKFHKLKGEIFAGPIITRQRTRGAESLEFTANYPSPRTSYVREYEIEALKLRRKAYRSI